MLHRAIAMALATCLGAWQLLGCASAKKANVSKEWPAMSAAQRQERLTRLPGFDTRLLQYNQGQLEFIEPPSRFAAKDSNAPNVVYIHGLGGNVGDFAPQILDTNQGRAVVAVNLPGTGQSTQQQRDYTIQAHVEALHELLVYRMGKKKINLVCHSLGGQVCLAYSLEYPAEVSSLTLIDAAGSYEQGEFAERMARQYGRVNLGQVRVTNHPAIALITGGNQDIIKRIVNGDAMMLSALDSYNHDYRDRIRSLAIPVLLIWGERDPVFPLRYGFYLLSNISGSRMKVVPGAGHVPQLTHPGLVSDWIAEFHRSLSPQPSETKKD